MVGWTIFLILLWIIWFCVAKRWVYPRKRTETDILIQAFNELSKEDAETDALNDTEKGRPRCSPNGIRDPNVSGKCVPKEG